MTDVIVIGGGVAGLAAADRLAAAGVEVTLLEAADRLGGNVRTRPFADRALDLGAEVLVRRDPTALELSRELSLDGDLVTPASSHTFVWTRRGLRPLPADALTRLPGRYPDLLRSRLLSPLGLARCGWDVIATSRAPEPDIAIGEIVRARLGRQVLERIVDPLLGGIHAGPCDTLSARALTPQLVDALATGKGLVRGLRATVAPTAGPAFATLRGGLGSLVAALAARAQDAGSSLRLDAPAIAVQPARGRVIVTQSDGDAVEAAACVVATPAAAAARMLTRAAPVAAAELAGIGYASAAVVALAYPAEALAGMPAGTGFVTAGEGRLVRACTWSSAKWVHLRGSPVIMKAFVGHVDAPPPTLSDRDLAAAVHGELTLAMRLRHRPVDLRIERFGSAIPQYVVGHQARVDRIEAALLPQLAIAGASYRGAGIAACIRSGHAACDRVLRRLDTTARSHA